MKFIPCLEGAQTKTCRPPILKSIFYLDPEAGQERQRLDRRKTRASELIGSGIDVIIFGAGKIGLAEIRAQEPAATEAGTGKISFREIRADEIRLADLAIQEFRLRHRHACEIAQLYARSPEGPVKQKRARLGKGYAEQLAAIEGDTPETRMVDLDVRKVAVGEDAVGKDRICEVASAEIAFLERTQREFPRRKIVSGHSLPPEGPIFIKLRFKCHTFAINNPSYRLLLRTPFATGTISLYYASLHIAKQKMK